MSDRDGSDPGGDQLEALLGIVRELAMEMRPQAGELPPFTLDSSLDRDIGLDSLARVELVSRVEKRFGMRIPERVFAEAQYLRDILEALGSGSTVATESMPRAKASVQASVAPQSVPAEAKTLVEVLKWHVQIHPDQTHIRLVDEDEQTEEVLSYRQLWEGARAVAAGLRGRGLQAGEAVAIMLPTGSEYFFSFFGVMLARGIPVPVYPPVRLAQLEDHLRRHSAILSNCRAVMLVTVAAAKGLAQLLKAGVDSLQSVVTVKDLAREPDMTDGLAPGAEDIAFLQYTSGSTGNPKGVVLTHANLLANIRAMGRAVRAEASDVFISWLPLYHDMGLIGAWLGSMYHCASLVVMSPLAFLTRPERWLWAIHRYRGTLSAAPNFAYELCLHRVDDQCLQGLDLRSWRAAFNGAEPVSPDTVERFCERFAPYGFRPEAMWPVYGLAEASVGLSMPSWGRGYVIDRIQREPFAERGEAIPVEEPDPRALRFVACGTALGGHEIRVVDAAGQELPERREGRLQFRGPSATRGYYENAEATHRLVRGEWLEPGDLAYIVDGEVYITGRTQDIIIRGGRNIYPHELEEAIGDLEDARSGRVAIFGIPDRERGTERLVVLAETRLKDTTAQERLRAEINALATTLAAGPPEDIVLAPPGTVLKTSSGKIRRSAARDLYLNGTIGQKRSPVWWQISRLALAGIGPLARRLGRAALGRLYGVYVWMLVILIAPITWISVVFLPRIEWRWKAARASARCVARAAGMSCSVQGAEHLPPAGHPSVLVANHSSYLDAYFIVAFLPRIVSFAAKAELAARFDTRVFLTRLGTQFVERYDRERGVADARRIARSLGEGRSLLFFPEGTFSRAPGLSSFHMGAFIAAAEAKVPCHPLAIRGTRSLLRADSWLPRRGHVSIDIGPPIEAGEDAPWPRALRLREGAREYILRHCGEPDLGHERALP